MIDKYKRKLILVSITVMFVVLASIVAGINLSNTIKIRQNADIIVNILLENDGQFPENADKIIIGKNENGNVYLNPEVPFSSRYFIVEVDKSGNVTKVNCDKVVAINEQTAVEKYEQIKDKKSAKGFVEIYRYGKKDTETGAFYLFLDRGEDVENYRVFLFYSIMFLIFGTLLVLILIVTFTEVILAPVEASYLKQKQFITDAGHELKTPLTVISANTELIEMEQGESEYTAEIIDQVSHLNELTKNLILLSKLDEGHFKHDFIKFNLSSCVYECVKKVSAVAQTSSKEFKLEIDENLEYFGSEENIKRMILLLLDNAIKYSKSDEIVIKAYKENKKIILSTTNKCEFEKGNYNQLFERFYRHDKSRNKQTGGNGIGLSVVQSVANMHDGSALATCDENGFLTIKITLGIVK